MRTILGNLMLLNNPLWPYHGTQHFLLTDDSKCFTPLHDKHIAPNLVVW
jgi:hypothetical protein